MDRQQNNVRVLEEEKFGWTILSTVRDDEQTPPHAGFAAQQKPDPLGGNETDERCAMTERHEGDPSVGEQKGEAESEEGDEPEEFAHAEEDDDADDELDEFGFDDAADEVDEAKVLPYGDSGKESLWGTGPRQEANAKQAIAERQPEQKQGLMWRVSLVATLGFFGWVVMSGLGGGGGKSIRCLKVHPCSIKDGEAVLSTL